MRRVVAIIVALFLAAVVALCLSWGAADKLPPIGPVAPNNAHPVDVEVFRASLLQRQALKQATSYEGYPLVVARTLQRPTNVDAAVAYVFDVIQLGADDGAWGDWFAQQGVRPPKLEVHPLRPTGYMTSYDTRCDIPVPHVTTSSPEIVLCLGDPGSTKADATLALPMTTLMEQPAGNLATIYAIAHALGHQATAWIAKSMQLEVVPEGRDSVLLADCFAGVWLGTLVPVSATTILSNLATLQPFIGSLESLFPGSAGFTAERAAALLAGYAGTTVRADQAGNTVQTGPGVPASCFGLWKGLPLFP